MRTTYADGERSARPDRSGSLRRWLVSKRAWRPAIPARHWVLRASLGGPLSRTIGSRRVATQSQIRNVVVLTSAVALAACAEVKVPEPETLAWRVVESDTDFLPSTVVDLDGDQRDDFVMSENRGPGPNAGVVSLIASDRSLIDQFRFEGRVLRPIGLDVDDDGHSEILVPFVRNDSLFVTVGDSQGNKLYSFFLVEGTPRVEPDGVLSWDPSIRWMETRPATSGTGRELVTLVSTGLARAPRGVLVNQLPGGARLGSWFTGAPLREPIRIDIDQDGRDEWFFATTTADNGAAQGGQHDRESYGLMVRMHPVPSLIWSRRFGGLPSSGSAVRTDTDGDGRDELLVFVWEPGQHRMETLDAATGTVRSVRLRTGLTHVLALDPGSAPTPRVIGRNSEMALELVGPAGQTLKRTAPGVEFGPPQYAADLTGDGRREIVVNVGAGQFLVLDEALDFVATGGRGYADESTPISIVRDPSGTSRFRLPKSRSDPTHVEARLVANPAWWWHRASPWVVPGSLLLLLASLTAALVHYRRLALSGAAVQNLGASADVWKLTSRQIAHDFKGPLNRVQGRLDHMQLEYADSDPQLVAKLDAQRAGIQEQIRSLTRRTDNFLKFVDVVEASRGLVELNDIVRESLSSFEPVQALGIDVELALSDEQIELYADRDQLLSLVENLVQNAVDAVGARGKITVATRLASGLQLEGSTAPGDYVLLEVRDTGRGMTPTVRSRLFEAGFSGSSRGSGLGLAIVHKIVADHGGRIDVDSELDLGTVFSIYLPAA